MNTRVRSRSAGSAGTILTALTVVNIIVGFIYQSYVAAQLGLSTAADHFQLTWTIVTFGATVLFTMVSTVMVPRATDPAFGALLRDVTLPAGLGFAISATQFLLSFAFTSSDLHLMLLISSPCAFLAGLAVEPTTHAYSEHRFVVAGAGPVANGVFLFGSNLAMAQLPEAQRLALSLVSGYVGQLIIVVIPQVKRLLAVRAGGSIRLSAFVALAGFTLLSKSQPLVERGLSTGLAAGATGALGFGQKVAQGLLLLAAYGLALSATASLARHHKARDDREAAGLFVRTFSATMVLTSVAVTAAVFGAYPVAVILFEHGAFTARDAAYVSEVILVQLPWVAASSLSGVLTAYLYVNNSYVRVLGGSLIGICATAILYFALQSVASSTSIAIASSGGAVATLVYLWRLIQKTSLSDFLIPASLPYRGLLWFCFMVPCCVVIAYAVMVWAGVSQGLVLNAALAVASLVPFAAIWFVRSWREAISGLFFGRL